MLLGSSNPTDRDLRRLRREEFGLLVCLLCDDEVPNYRVDRARSLGFVWHAIPIRDFGAPSIAQLQDFVKLLARLPRHEKIVVHCEGGVGRTGTFGAAHWVARGMSAAAAIAHVRDLNPHAIATPDQEAAVRHFAEKFRRRRHSDSE